MKVVLNDGYGGFGLSIDALLKYAKLKGVTLYFYEPEMTVEKSFYTRISATKAKKSWISIILTRDLGKFINRNQFNKLDDKQYFSIHDIKRHDPDLVEVVWSMGTKANDQHSQLKIIDIPDDVEYDIHAHAGNEWLVEKHRTWS